MRTKIAGIVACTALFAAVGASADPSEKHRADAGTEICGHVGEMIAAKQALEAGQKDVALRHLKEARRILAACDQRMALEEKDDAISI